MQRISLSGSAVWPPLTWPTTSVSASSTTSAPMRPEPGIEGPPVWMVDWMPYLRAQATICFAFAPSFTPPRPTSPRSFTPASASSLKSCSVMPGSITGAPACSLTPLTRKLLNARWAKMACALRPTMSRGRPGWCTSPAEIIVVTPPCSVESIQPSWFWRGVQSPETGWTWLSMSPGATTVPFASTTVVAPSASTSFARPTATMRPSTATIVSASRIGFSIAPESRRPMLRITVLPAAPVAGAS